jgi:ankyrin repeat protein
MDLGIVKTIRWALGIDEELNQLRAQLDQAKTECDAKIEAVKEENKQYADLERKLHATSAEVSDLKDIVAPQRAPLLTAPFWNYTDVVAAKLKPLIQSNFGQGAMSLASLDNQPELITLFVKLGVKVDSKNLWIAARSGNEEVFYRLVKHGADINILNENDDTLIKTSPNFCRGVDFMGRGFIDGNNKRYSCLEKKMIKMVDNGYNVSYKHEPNLLYAANLGLYAVMSKLVESGANINESVVGRDPSTILAVTCGGSKIGAAAKAIELGNYHVARGFLKLVSFDNFRCSKPYEDLFIDNFYSVTKECINGMAEFLYIVKELQAAYAEDMKSSAHVQTDGGVTDHLEDVPLLGHHE